MAWVPRARPGPGVILHGGAMVLGALRPKDAPPLQRPRSRWHPRPIGRRPDLDTHWATPVLITTALNTTVVAPLRQGERTTAQPEANGPTNGVGGTGSALPPSPTRPESGASCWSHRSSCSARSFVSLRSKAGYSRDWPRLRRPRRGSTSNSWCREGQAREVRSGSAGGSVARLA